MQVFNQPYQIVTLTTTGIPIGTVCYLQSNKIGASIGLLLSLTYTPYEYIKVISTSIGFIPVNI